MFIEELLGYQSRGTGAIIRWNDCFLFVLGKQEYWKKIGVHWRISYTNTGGHVEKNENIIAATKREVYEELGCDLDLRSSNNTIACTLEDSKLSYHELEDKICPILIYNSSELQMSVCVYLGIIHSNPIPMMEVPALVFLPPSLIHGGEIATLLNTGAKILLQDKKILPKNVILEPFGSADIMVRFWDEFHSLDSFNDFLEE